LTKKQESIFKKTTKRDTKLEIMSTMAQNTALTIPQVLLEQKKKFDITSILAAAAREPQSPVISNTSSNSSSNSGSNSDPETSKHLERSPSPVEIIPNNESPPKSPEKSPEVKNYPLESPLTYSRRSRDQSRLRAFLNQ
jgi:hypothetical protein